MTDGSRTVLNTADTSLHDPAVNRVRETFQDHLSRAHGGMSFCVYRDGRPLIRLHGGSFERRTSPDEPIERPWDERTLAVMFSGTKGITATLVAMAVDRGLLDVNEPVARYWPEFAAGGKEHVSVAQVLDHTVGLVYTDPEPPAGMLDSSAHAAVLAQQKPLWEPGSKVAYHAVTFGHMVEELLVRVTGHRAGRLLRDHVARPHGLELYLGLPAELEDRVAPVFRAPGYAISTFLEDPQRRAVVERMYGNALLGEELPANSREFHASGLVSGGGIAGADAIARFYSLVASGELVSPATLETFTRTWSHGRDAVNDRPVAFGLGFEVQDPLGTYGPVERAYGHSGAGGCLHGVWPDARIGFSFHTNEMLSENVDRRAKDLLAALAECDLG
ncbi:serine hydrolase domain-containing protein [Kocuria marina]|uniref:serine hydrolase domain-containing protein n=1 Tax=Kocuria marina TaxID=223184 RepID=UPI0022E5AD5F|nr:serine hydrolase domain-containing protein [Kocuria marina]